MVQISNRQSSKLGLSELGNHLLSINDYCGLLLVALNCGSYFSQQSSFLIFVIWAIDYLLIRKLYYCAAAISIALARWMT